ncbi:MAG: hypothetical protein AAFN43_10895, partial [Pseudomonadota bacterium]
RPEPMIMIIPIHALKSGLLMVYRENRNAKQIASAVPMRAAPTNTLTVQEDELLFQSKTKE